MIYTIGETVLDIIFKEMLPISAKAGGSALNTSINLARLQNPVSFVSELGGDEPGIYCKTFLQKNKVDVSHLNFYSSRKTSLALAFLNKKNDATYQFYKDLPDSFRCDDIKFSNCDIVLFSSSFAISERVRPQLINILNSAMINSAIIMYDPNMRKQITKHSLELEYIFENFKKADIVRASDEDCMNIFGFANSQKVYKKLQEYGVKIFICTKNSSSVEIYTPKFNSEYEVPEIVPVSTIGAGDTFNAGILHFLNQKLLNYTDVTQIPRTFWDAAIPFAIACATAVCCSWENYLSGDEVKMVLGNTQGNN